MSGHCLDKVAQNAAQTHRQLGQTAEEKVVVVEGVVSADPLVPPARKLELAKTGKVVVAAAAFAAVPAFLRQVNDVKVSGVDGRHLRQVDHGQQRAAVVVVVAVVVVFHPPVARYDGQSAKGGRLVRSERLGEQVRQAAAAVAVAVEEKGSLVKKDVRFAGWFDGNGWFVYFSSVPLRL